MAGPSIMVRVLGDVAGLGTSFDDASGKGTSAAGRLHSAFTGVLGVLNQAGVLGPFGAALASADAAVQAITGHSKEVGPVMMGVGAAVAGVGMALQAAGSKDQAAHQQLQASVEATGHSYEQYSGQVEAAIKHQEGFGTQADVTQDALRNLTTATGDPTKALDLLNTAADLAAAKHMSLSDAAAQLGKVYNGNTRLLKQFGIDTKDNTGATKSQSEIMTELSTKLSGQASAAANTFTGHLNAMKATVMDHIALFGQKYGPAITTAGAAMTGLGAAVEVARALQLGHIAATVAETVATGAQTAAQWALNAAMSANPIMLVVLAIAALVAIVILCYQHVTIFRQIVDDAGRIAAAAFGAILNAAAAVWGWIASHWPLLLAILTGPFGLAVYEIAKHWDTIVGFAAAIPGRIVAALGDVGNILYDAGKAIIDGLGRGIEDAFKKVTDFVGGIAGKIASLKGPIDYDATLLVPHGTAIMAGFNSALAAGMDDTERLMRSVAPTIASAAPAVSNPAGAAAGGPAVHIENAHFGDQLDVDAFMSRVAWTVKAKGL